MEELSFQPIRENLWWVIPAKLAGVRKPTATELSELQLAGIGAIVSVFHENSNLNLYKQAQIPHLWLPIEVDSIPSPTQMQEFHSFVDDQNRSGHAVAVHCSTGKHRTGTVLATYLIRNGLSYESAIKIILDASSQTKLPDTQTRFLQSFLSNVSENRRDGTTNC